MSSIFHITLTSILDRSAVFDIAMLKTHMPIMQLLFTGRAFYKKVAESESKNLEEIFYLTNSIDEPWTLGKRVKPRFEQCRSTSVGDIVEVDNQFFLVCMSGFKACEFDFHLHAQAFEVLDSLKKDRADFLDKELTPLQISMHLVQHMPHQSPTVAVAETFEKHVKMWILAQHFRLNELDK